MQRSSIIIEKFEYYSFASFILIVGQSVCCGFICFASKLNVVVEMDKKNYTLSEVFDFVTYVTSVSTQNV